MTEITSINRVIYSIDFEQYFKIISVEEKEESNDIFTIYDFTNDKEIRSDQLTDVIGNDFDLLLLPVEGEKPTRYKPPIKR